MRTADGPPAGSSPSKVLPFVRNGVTYAVQYVLDPERPEASGSYVLELGEGGQELRRHGPMLETVADHYRDYLEHFPIGDPRD